MEDSNTQYLEIKILGRAQGVGFRYFAKRNAEKLGVKGFCKNLDDGSVLMNVFGEKEITEKFLEKLHKGPLFARVDEIKVREIDKFSYEDFKIL